jgi:hypothetical protein
MANAKNSRRSVGYVGLALREVGRFLSRHPWILIPACAPIVAWLKRRTPPTWKGPVDEVLAAIGCLLLAALGALLLWSGARVVWKHVRRRAVAPDKPIPRFYGVSYTDVHSGVRVCHLIPFNLLVGTIKLLTNRLKEGLGVEIERQPADRRR